MAKTFFQPVGKWFPRGGKTAVFSPADKELFLFVLECDEDTLGSMAEWNKNGASASGKNGNYISTISRAETPNVVTDIPDGIVFYLTDNKDGNAPSASNLGCFITWSE